MTQRTLTNEFLGVEVSARSAKLRRVDIKDPALIEARIAIAALERKYEKKLEKNYELSRSLVSFQANKVEPGYRWFKFKEGFSSSLVKYSLKKLGINPKKFLDPFAGSGTTLFVASEIGSEGTGIELLPISSEIMEIRKYLANNENKKAIGLIDKWLKEKPWEKHKKKKPLNHLRITEGAFPPENKDLLERYVALLDIIRDPELRHVMRFAALCVLEEISYTRKDGQYLRWDKRSGRKQGSKPFDKGEIKNFSHAITTKLEAIKTDLGTDTSHELFQVNLTKADASKVKVINGSCLEILPKLNSNSHDFLMTSPPYCNRYDYTRTYALELALLGIDEQGIRDLRQKMLSATVENRDKAELQSFFSKTFTRASGTFNRQFALRKILEYLESLKQRKELNNPGIVRMVKNYFLEMALVIFESSRILKKGSYFIMVNDNVRYAGVNIPVDLILSDFAEKSGFEVKKIWVLPRGKGNSSQQMGSYGREEMRKCVYVWQKL